MRSFSQLSLNHQFMLVSFFILVGGMIVIAVWVGQQIERGVINHTALVTALYADSFIAPHLQELATSESLKEEHQHALDALLTDTSLGQRIVAFKVWSKDGTVLYSTNPVLIGRNFRITSGIADALNGEVHTSISYLAEEENQYERESWPRLLETYAPVRAKGTDTILAVSEFYQLTDDLEREVFSAQWRSWLILSGATFVMYLLLVGLVRRANNTIIAQQGELQNKIGQQNALIDQNERLHERVRRAAARTTALNERFLRRISSDLHDGPAQGLGLGLLRIGSLREICESCPITKDKGQPVREQFQLIQDAMQSALAELREIAAGLPLPSLDTLSVKDVVHSAIKDYQRKTGQNVNLLLSGVQQSAPLPVKITLYRLLQESFANSYRHADGIGLQVEVSGTLEILNVKIADAGPGIDEMNTAHSGEHLGLSGMRERVEILGGTFNLSTKPQEGVRIEVQLPLNIVESDHE